MKWKFSLLRKVQLGLMSLLVMGTTCKRNAPRYEPDPLICGATSFIMGSSLEEQSIASDAQLENPFVDKLLEHYKNSKDVANFLKDIDWNGGLTLNVTPSVDLQNDFSASIEASLAIVSHDGKGQPNGLPNRLCIFFERNRQDGSWAKRRLVGTASITIKSNPILPNSEKDSFALIAFWADISSRNDLKAHPVVAFVKEDQQWCFYNNNNATNDSVKTALSTKDAMRLASEKGTTFFYQKIIKKWPLVKSCD